MTVSLTDVQPTNISQECNNAESMILDLLGNQKSTQQMKSLAKHLIEQLKD